MSNLLSRASPLLKQLNDALNFAAGVTILFVTGIVGIILYILEGLGFVICALLFLLAVLLYVVPQDLWYWHLRGVAVRFRTNTLKNTPQWVVNLVAIISLGAAGGAIIIIFYT